MRHRLVEFASAVSLPLLLLALLLCAISTLHPLRWSQTRDYYSFNGGGPVFQRHFCVGLSNGMVYAQAVDRGVIDQWNPIKNVIPGYPVDYRLRSVFGFSLHHEKAKSWSYREWAFPLWPFALVFAIYPMRAYFRRRRAARAGLCSRCSYNLMGNLSGVCPECGTRLEAEPRTNKSDSALARHSAK